MIWDLIKFSDNLTFSTSEQRVSTEIEQSRNEYLSMTTLNDIDDIDEDEAFIMELMAMHPNDDDLIVEDLEDAPLTIPLIRIDGVDSEGETSDVRKLLTKLKSSLCSCSVYLTLFYLLISCCFSL